MLGEFKYVSWWFDCSLRRHPTRNCFANLQLYPLTVRTFAYKCWCSSQVVWRQLVTDLAYEFKYHFVSLTPVPSNRLICSQQGLLSYSTTVLILVPRFTFWPTDEKRLSNVTPSILGWFLRHGLPHTIIRILSSMWLRELPMIVLNKVTEFVAVDNCVFLSAENCSAYYI